MFFNFQRMNDRKNRKIYFVTSRGEPTCECDSSPATADEPPAETPLLAEKSLCTRFEFPVAFMPRIKPKSLQPDFMFLFKLIIVQSSDDQIIWHLNLILKSFKSLPFNFMSFIQYLDVDNRCRYTRPSLFNRSRVNQDSRSRFKFKQRSWNQKGHVLDNTVHVKFKRLGRAASKETEILSY